MKKLLITGFEPFGGELINPSWEVVSRLPDEINGYTLTKLLVPVVFGEAARITVAKAREIDADAVLSIGQAGGRAAVTPELVAINLRHGNIPDNNGCQPIDEKIEKEGENAYFSTIPVRKVSDAVKAAGIASAVSYSAGAYVCNDLLYSVLHAFSNTRVRAGFIHIPYSKEQGKDPSLSLDDLIKAVTVAIENI